MTALSTDPAQPLALERLMTVDEVAAVLQMSKDWVYRHRRELKALKLGRELRFEPGDLRAWMTRTAGRL
ncbi:MAG TPA: helix-turn-helix domain-containing protein [Mycobacteriales bacterium]|jgi:excisionase family DNA binding protein|nr:helix-turn-helix domain-containing protein [Mycobacteriales bacterium]